MATNTNKKVSKNKRVSELITKEEVKTWTPDVPVIIEAGTGVGKSYFIKNTLYDIAKEEGQKILFLIHRRKCVDQFIMEIEADGKDDVIDIATYQKFSAHKSIFSDFDEEYNPYDYAYIVSDEYHYFTEDAKFNDSTDIAYDMIMSCPTAVKIFMSATGENIESYMRDYLNENAENLGISPDTKPIKYRIPTNWSFINQLYFFYREDAFERKAEEVIAKGTKAIFFLESAKKAYELYKKFADNAIFCCSESNKEYAKYMDKNKLNQMLENEKFDENLLITTACLDAGVNIKDKDVKEVMLDISDLGSLIQCMGRRRIARKTNGAYAEKIDVYIRAKTNEQLGGMITQMKKEIEPAQFLDFNGEDEFYKQYPRFNANVDKSGIIYTDRKQGNHLKVNQLMLRKRESDIKLCTEMINLSEYGYCTYLADKFGRKHKYKRGEIIRMRYEIYKPEYFDTMFTLARYAEEKTEFCDKSQKDKLVQELSLKKNGRIVKTAKTINERLVAMGIPFQIQETRTKRKIDGCSKDVRIWKIVRTK
ncbi:DEAD/DEAH box helicase family protein [Anaerostipes faecalis]|uniref:DEAD/DEAH box helicase family protein n=1 Tax=Anaerostipes faecalis TaxID=2738446 RepID=UPI003F108181